MSSAGSSFALFWKRSASAPLLRLHRLSLSLLAGRYKSSLNTEVATLSLRPFRDVVAFLSFVIKLDRIISFSVESNSWPASPQGWLLKSNSEIVESLEPEQYCSLLVGGSSEVHGISCSYNFKG